MVGKRAKAMNPSLFLFLFRVKIRPFASRVRQTIVKPPSVKPLSKTFLFFCSGHRCQTFAANTNKEANVSKSVGRGWDKSWALFTG
jgi:hypothetical protein